MTQLTFPLQQPMPPDPVLMSETGWTDVARGLNRILIGNLVLILLPLFGLLLIVVALTQGGDPGVLLEKDKFHKAGYEIFLLFLGGILAIAVSGFIGYPLILFGRIQCLVNVPERCGAKWLMFVCVLALIAGPALGIFAGVLGAGRDWELEKKGRKPKAAATRTLEEAMPKLDKEMLTKSYFWLNVGSVVLSLTSEICFLLFLRAVAHCFHAQNRVAMVDFYFILVGGILVTILYVLFGSPALPVAVVLLLLVGLGMIASVVWYLVLIGSVSWCVTDGIEQLRPSTLAPPASCSAAH